MGDLGSSVTEFCWTFLKFSNPKFRCLFSKHNFLFSSKTESNNYVPHCFQSFQRSSEGFQSHHEQSQPRRPMHTRETHRGWLWGWRVLRTWDHGVYFWIHYFLPQSCFMFCLKITAQCFRSNWSRSRTAKPGSHLRWSLMGKFAGMCEPMRSTSW